MDKKDIGCLWCIDTTTDVVECPGHVGPGHSTIAQSGCKPAHPHLKIFRVSSRSVQAYRAANSFFRLGDCLTPYSGLMHTKMAVMR